MVLDTFSRRVVGWSIDSSPAASLVTNALSMAIGNRSPEPGTIVHSDRGTQFSSWAFTHRVRESGRVPSIGSVGDCYDNAVIEAFWARLQTELLDQRRWRTRLELSNALLNTWRSSTIANAGTARSECCRRLSTRSSTRSARRWRETKFADSPRPRANHRVHESGSSSMLRCSWIKVKAHFVS